jgi:hypothetical protein
MTPEISISISPREAESGSWSQPSTPLPAAHSLQGGPFGSPFPTLRMELDGFYPEAWAARHNHEIWKTGPDGYPPQKGERNRL